MTGEVGSAGRADAPQVLAQRLADQMRLAGPIQDPVGWLIARGLPQRQKCGDVRCDDRVLLDSGRDCPRCEERQADRRAQRRAVAAAVDAVMPHASENARKWGKDEPSLGDSSTDVAKLVVWYIQRKPGHTAGIFGEICLIARTRLALPPEEVGRLLRRSLHLDSKLDGKTINALLDLALPPSAKRAGES